MEAKAVKTTFYVHLVVYVLVNILLIVVNLITTPENLWFYWPILGWGIGIIGHYILLTFFSEQKSKK
ncbi:Pr2TM family membrane protein [Candidatus Falkowbacteria bacterium]|nr:Pr2TM family membrane protein [Candidatus Falkowbacteria bacterium]MBT4433539.1 Pr2TM family membrane protein [Candidatus Falkowbacteria bacterium]